MASVHQALPVSLGLLKMQKQSGGRSGLLVDSEHCAHFSAGNLRRMREGYWKVEENFSPGIQRSFTLENDPGHAIETAQNDLSACGVV